MAIAAHSTPRPFVWPERIPIPGITSPETQVKPKPKPGRATRRGALAAALAAMSGATVALPARPDADLIAMCRRYIEEDIAMSSDMSALRLEAQEALLDAIVATPATSIAGIAAKAEIALGEITGLWDMNGAADPDAGLARDEVNWFASRLCVDLIRLGHDAA